MKSTGILNTFLFSGLLVIFTSCIGQSVSPLPGSASGDRHLIIGDTVKELGTHLMHIFQDSKNNYWFGSSTEGVYYYDGRHIIHYTAGDGLCHNKIEQIQEDAAGNIYFNTSKGISRFDGQAFTTLTVTGNEWKLEPGDLWFKGAQDSGVVYRYDGRSLHRLKFPETKAGKDFIAKYPRSQYPAMTFNPYDIYSIYKDRKGAIWFGGATLGVCRYDGRSADWISEDDVTELDDGPANGVRSIIEDKDGYFWFSNTRYRYNIYDHHDVSEGRRNARVATSINYRKEKIIGGLDGEKEGSLDFYLSIAKDNNGDLWMATYNDGVWKYDGKNITHYPVREGGTTITLFSVYKDNRGSLWLGTHDAGVYKFNGKAFERFKPF